MFNRVLTRPKPSVATRVASKTSIRSSTQHFFATTPLHQVIRNSRQDLSEFKQSMTQLSHQYGPQSLKEFAITLDQEGRLPLEIAHDFFDESQMAIVEWTLLAAMLPTKVKKLTDLISTADVQKRYPEANSELAMNLRIGCQMANLTRKSIQHSTTHPDMNRPHLSLTFKDNLNQRLIKMRHTYLDAHYQLRNSLGRAIEDPGLRKQFDNQLLYELTTSFTQEYRIGNCAEFSALSLGFLQSLKNIHGLSQPYGDIISFDKGDHSVCVIGGNDQHDPAHYKQWHPATVVVDSWVGDVYPAYEIPERLKNYKRIYVGSGLSSYNILINFNEKHDRFVSSYAPPKTGLDLFCLFGRKRDEQESGVEELRTRANDSSDNINKNQLPPQHHYK